MIEPCIFSYYTIVFMNLLYLVKNKNHRKSVGSQTSLTRQTPVSVLQSTFRLSDGSAPTREAFLRILSDIEAILIRATYHTITSYTSLRDLRMDTAIPTVTSLGRTPMVKMIYICCQMEEYLKNNCNSTKYLLNAEAFINIYLPFNW
jgi:hypothetical protein